MASLTENQAKQKYLKYKTKYLNAVKEQNKKQDTKEAEEGDGDMEGGFEFDPEEMLSNVAEFLTDLREIPQDWTDGLREVLKKATNDFATGLINDNQPAFQSTEMQKALYSQLSNFRRRVYSGITLALRLTDKGLFNFLDKKTTKLIGNIGKFAYMAYGLTSNVSNGTLKQQLLSGGGKYDRPLHNDKMTLNGSTNTLINESDFKTLVNFLKNASPYNSDARELLSQAYELYKYLIESKNDVAISDKDIPNLISKIQNVLNTIPKKLLNEFSWFKPLSAFSTSFYTNLAKTPLDIPKNLLFRVTPVLEHLLTFEFYFGMIRQFLSIAVSEPSKHAYRSAKHKINKMRNPEPISSFE
jgi:hypothetical protein